MKRKQRFFKLSAIVGCILLGAGMLLCGAGFVGMGCNWKAFTYPRGGEPVAVSSFVEADAVDSIEIHASMGDVKIERASAANPEEVEFVLAENVYQVIVQHGLLLVMPQDSYTATGLGVTEVKQQGDSLLVYKEKFDVAEVGPLIKALGGRVLLSAGSRPYISVKMAGQPPLEALAETLSAMQDVSSPARA